MRIRWSGTVAFGGALLVLCSAAMGKVSLPDFFADHMVLQADAPVNIWGWADAREKVTISIAGQESSTEANAEGEWKITLKPLSVGGPHKMTVAGQNTIDIEDVLIGQVWVCSGQSNMAWTVKQSHNADEEFLAARHPKIRMFTVERVTSKEPKERLEGSWQVCSPENVGNFSAVGYFFARSLNQAIDEPVGMLHTSWGGTPSEAWTTREMLESLPVAGPTLDRWSESVRSFPEAVENYERQLAEWQKKADVAKSEGKESPEDKPKPPRDPSLDPHHPSVLYNAMIHPLIPYTITGAIWYQGESNASRAHQYRTIFSAMIRDWRDQWDQGDFPFLFVQLANFETNQRLRSGDAWAELREAQTMALDLPNAGMAVTIDIGNPSDIHPKNKQDVGHRLALGALKLAYDKKIAHCGPTYKSMKSDGGKVVLSFDQVHGGLKSFTRKNGRLPGPYETSDKLIGFTIAGKDQKFVEAQARIDGDHVVVWSEAVSEPVSVRYAWDDAPEANLYNAAGLPALPFRTDDWPCVTEGQF